MLLGSVCSRAGLHSTAQYIRNQSLCPEDYRSTFTEV